MPGPLPQPSRRRTNAPTIPTTNLPAAGRQGRAPNPPKWVMLDEVGREWWAWAWHTPQAAAWSAGDLPLIARRARIESAIAEGPVVPALMRESRELDDRLGLSPKGMAALRWKIVDSGDAAAPDLRSVPAVADIDPRRARRRAG